MVRTVPATAMFPEEVLSLPVVVGLSPPVPADDAVVKIVSAVVLPVPTVTLMVTAELAVAAIGVGFVQVTVWPVDGVPEVTEQLQPVPVPLTKVSPMGSVSVIVSVGSPVGPGPRFVAVIVNDAACPRVKMLGECVMGVAVSEISGRVWVRLTHQVPTVSPPRFSVRSCL